MVVLSEAISWSINLLPAREICVRQDWFMKLIMSA
jgi:hypothetical protein